jgi:hemerythrin-like domain-containing protein
MLTATYTLVALSVEQASIRLSLQSLQKLLHTNFRHQAALGAGQVGYACDLLQRLYHNCHWRKIDMFLIPTVRRTSEQADTLLAELDALSARAGHAIAKVADRVGSVAVDTEAAVDEFCSAIETFCSAMLERLDREESELFAFARSVISGEAWFSIANNMLAHEAQRDENKPARHAVLPGELAQAPARGRQFGAAPTFAS